jgi:hypothetical protein
MVIHEILPDGCGGHGNKVRAIAPFNAGLIVDFQDHFMHQSGGLKRVVGRLTPKCRPGHGPKFAIHQRQKLLGRDGIAVACVVEQASCFLKTAHRALINAGITQPQDPILPGCAKNTDCFLWEFLRDRG